MDRHNGLYEAHVRDRIGAIIRHNGIKHIQPREVAACVHPNFIVDYPQSHWDKVRRHVHDKYCQDEECYYCAEEDEEEGSKEQMAEDNTG